MCVRACVSPFSLPFNFSMKIFVSFFPLSVILYRLASIWMDHSKFIKHYLAKCIALLRISFSFTFYVNNSHSDKCSSFLSFYLLLLLIENLWFVIQSTSWAQFRRIERAFCLFNRKEDEKSIQKHDGSIIYLFANRNQIILCQFTIANARIMSFPIFKMFPESWNGRKKERDRVCQASILIGFSPELR